MKKLIVLAAAILVACVGLAAWPQQDTGKTQTEKTVKKVAVKATPANSGEKMYKEYCASCHGLAGKGDGPAASALKVPPTDLTQLTRNNNGKFPADHFDAVLRFGTEVPAHGTADMPVWGYLLQKATPGATTAGDVQLRIANLRNYVETLQAK